VIQRLEPSLVKNALWGLTWVRRVSEKSLYGFQFCRDIQSAPFSWLEWLLLTHGCTTTLVCYVRNHIAFTYASANIVQLEALFPGCLWVCLCLCTCIPNVVNINILKSIGYIFSKLSALMRFRTTMNTSIFDVKRSKVKVTAWPTLNAGHRVLISSSYVFIVDVLMKVPLESRMRLSKLPTDQSLVAAGFSSHYEIIDADLYSYILTMDAKAWRRYLHGIIVCPFCSSEVTPTGSCCRRFSELRLVTSTAADEKHYVQEVVKSKGSKSRRKKFGSLEEAQAKQRTKDHLATRSVCSIHNVFIVFCLICF